jgi:hypothetical protein
VGRLRPRGIETWFLYAEHYRGHAEPSVHAAAIRARGEWIPGCIDPAARGRSQDDGKKLTDSYRDLGLELYLADHAVEAGIFDVYQRLSTGTLKVFTLLRRGSPSTASIAATSSGASPRRRTT